MDPEVLLLSPKNRVALENVMLLESVLKDFSRSSWFKRRASAKEIAALCLIISNERVNLWAGIRDQYPQCWHGSWTANGEHVRQTDL